MFWILACNRLLWMNRWFFIGCCCCRRRGRSQRRCTILPLLLLLSSSSDFLFFLFFFPFTIFSKPTVTLSSLHLLIYKPSQLPHNDLNAALSIKCKRSRSEICHMTKVTHYFKQNWINSSLINIPNFVALTKHIVNFIRTIGRKLSMRKNSALKWTIYFGMMCLLSPTMGLCIRHVSRSHSLPARDDDDSSFFSCSIHSAPFFLVVSYRSNILFDTFIRYTYILSLLSFTFVII